MHINFVDWIPGICSALGMLVINSIEKSRLSADSYSYSGTGVAWKARLVLFLGFALMAGGLAGSVVSKPTSENSNTSRMAYWTAAFHGRIVADMWLAGCPSTQICGPRLFLSNFIFRNRQRHCEWFDNAELCCTVGIPEYGR